MGRHPGERLWKGFNYGITPGLRQKRGIGSGEYSPLGKTFCNLRMRSCVHEDSTVLHPFTAPRFERICLRINQTQLARWLVDYRDVGPDKGVWPAAFTE